MVNTRANDVGYLIGSIGTRRTAPVLTRSVVGQLRVDKFKVPLQICPESRSYPVKATAIDFV